jgi:hypothetical protein
MKQKAQASTEYLVILAVVIVVAVVVASLMGDFLNLSGETSEKSSKIYWERADIGLMDWLMSANGQDVIVVRNNLEYDLEIINITINDVEQSINLTLMPGDEKTIRDDWVECEKGSGYAYYVTFLYDNIQFNLTGKTFTGNKRIGGDCQA